MNARRTLLAALSAHRAGRRTKRMLPPRIQPLPHPHHRRTARRPPLSTLGHVARFGPGLRRRHARRQRLPAQAGPRRVPRSRRPGAAPLRHAVRKPLLLRPRAGHPGPARRAGHTQSGRPATPRRPQRPRRRGPRAARAGARDRHDRQPRARAASGPHADRPGRPGRAHGPRPRRQHSPSAGRLHRPPHAHPRPAGASPRSFPPSAASQPRRRRPRHLHPPLASPRPEAAAPIQPSTAAPPSRPRHRTTASKRRKCAPLARAASRSGHAHQRRHLPSRPLTARASPALLGDA